ncbi:MAG: patatin-like phospholipase family protein [Okeania sp. SIO3H1]|nr:patatin-like phospholipase family protein [Okeania sp. SIO3H1]
MVQKIILWLGLVGVVVTAWLLLPSAFWQYVFFLRIPLLMGLLLIFLPVLATTALKSMLKNLFVLRNARQIALTILGATVAGMAVTFVFAIILDGAPARFGVPELPGVFDYKFWYYLLAIGLALPTSLTVFQLSQEEMDNNNRKFGFFLGLLFGVIFLFLFKLIRNFLSVDKVPGLNEGLVKAVSFLTQNSSKGLGYVNNGILKDTHFDALVFFIALFAIYIIAFKRFMPSSLPDKKRQEPPALLYVMLLISVSVLLLGSLTFFFDYSRISVLFFWVLIAIACYRLFKVDHYFTLKDAPEQLEEQKNLTALLQKRLDKQDLEEPLAKQTVVVVCASGGGIQAAGWTAQVLTGLQEELGESFTKAIGLISSVSGGSVGAMYYLDRFTDKGFPPASESEEIFEGATANSLDAVGWGLVYPDLWRVIFLPFLPDILTPKVRDRGIAIEKDWQGHMKTPERPKTLADWRGEVEKGNIPLPVLNATLVDNGWRLLVTPAKFPNPDKKKFFDFNSLYPGKDIDLVTGARLSATFPYISPICRADDRNGKVRNIANYHVADGGYFDNSGFVTALEWLEELLREKPTQKGEETTPEIKRILILQINPFPESKPKDKPKKEKKRGLFMATIGPLIGLFEVREPILTSRNLTEVELLQEWENARQNGGKVEIEYFPIFFPSITEEVKLGLKTAEQEVTPELKAKQSFYSAEGEYEPPLSWKLTKREKEEIRKGWNKIVTVKEGTIEKLKNLWLDQWNMK